MSTIPKVCVIGWPIAQSRSPMIHGFWLKQHGIAGSYEKRAVPPQDLTAFVAELRTGAFAGCNVTVPHKEAIMPLLDDITPTARAIGAVNTVWREDGRLIGGNTDAEGFLANLDELAPGWDAAPLRAVILGAGGASRALAHGLVSRGAEAIVVVNRSRARAEALAAELGAPLTAAGLDDLSRHLGTATLLVNATSLGMTGKEPLEVDLAALNPAALVSDIVYVPLRTGLLEQAERSGFRTAEGLGMLLHQAVPGFEKWFGVRPTVTPDLRALVEADITGSAAR
jgi:shikimate dehydrogenase